MNKIFVAVIFFTSIFLISPVWAEDLADDFKPSLIGLNHDQKKLFDYLEIERLIVEGKYRTPSTDGWKSFARLYEEYTDLFCFESVNYKFQSPLNPNLSATCRYYLRNLKKYNPTNPHLPCSENGLGSEQCKNAYLVQYITREGGFTTGSNSMSDFEAKISALSQESMKTRPNELDVELKALAVDFKKEENAEKWIKFKALISEKIDYECQAVGVSFVDFEPPDFMMGANLIEHQRYTSDQLYKEAYDLLHDPDRLGNFFIQGGFNKVDPTANEKLQQPHPFEILQKEQQVEFIPKAYWRVRRISTTCYESILEGLRFNVALPAAICNLHGIYSPFCLNADKELEKNLPLYIRTPEVIKQKYEMGTF